jgi:hypothetical protein
VGAPTQASAPSSGDAVVYYSDGLAPLPWSVGQLLTGLQTGNAQQFYDQLTSAAQKKVPLTDVQSLFSFYKKNGVTFQRFVYTGGIYLQGGVSNYTVQVVGLMNGKTFVSPWYFEVDSSNHIAHFADIDQLIDSFDSVSQ